MNTKLLKDFRFYKRLTQKDVSDELGINVITYMRKENGDRQFSPEEIVRVSKVLNLNIVQVNEIFFDNELPIGN